MPDEGAPAPAPIEAREVLVGAPLARPMRTRTWTRGEPVVEIHTGGGWHLAHLLQRKDGADGAIVYGVTIAAGTSSTYRTYVWDPASIRPVRAATTEPTERVWS